MNKIIFTTIILIFCSCGPRPDPANCHIKVTIQNNSDMNIYYIANGGNPISVYNPLRSEDYFKIVPGTLKIHGFGRDRGCYEELFSENNNKLYYLLYDEQVLLNNPWDTIVKYDKVLKRYSFTVQEMQAVNWVINYP